MSLYFAISIGAGLALDFLLGDPRKMPHLVRLIGLAIGGGERLVSTLFGRNVFAGLILWLLLVGGFGGAYWWVSHALAEVNVWLRVGFDSVLVFQCIAYRDLVRHVRAVRLGLERSLAEGRARVSWIVGRDTDRMERDDVCRAAIESGSENLNDSVVAPLFWGLVFGPVGFLVFRVCNTLDAMVGHRNERYEKLGKVSARMDDVLNYLPARICAALTLRLSEIGSLRALKSDAKKHPSVNAGWPEAAMCHRLGVVIGGRMYEGGELVQTAEMNEGARQPDLADIEGCIRIMGTVYAKALALGGGLLCLASFL